MNNKLNDQSFIISVKYLTWFLIRYDQEVITKHSALSSLALQNLSASILLNILES